VWRIGPGVGEFLLKADGQEMLLLLGDRLLVKVDALPRPELFA
jgi:hypothetical protein